ncbi:MAG TPA: SRPBCC family protein [Chloroflexota bacterium]|jgi:uncharacterized protein YndB with AHSA1/START domain|nr:SRPBCC family protein [Chloroflexota bacterium]
MAAYGRSRQTRAAPETVWRLWSDTSTWHDWNPNVERMEVNGPFINGTTGVMHTPAGQHHQIELTNIQPGHSFDLQTTVIPLTHFTFHCEVVPHAGGSTISQAVTVSGPLGFIFGPMAGDRIAASFEPLLAGLASKAEASG